MKQNFLFWALEGERYDGHDFVSRAIQDGAAAAVIRSGFEPEVPAQSDAAILAVGDTLKALGDFAAWWRRQHDSQVVGITGSAGKTTTKEMAAAVLGRMGETLRNQGNWNNLIGLPSTLLFLEAKHRYAVLEMGMNRPGEIGRLTEIADPEVGVITNVAKAHLEGVGSLEGVARAKVELMERMPSRGTALLNGDDPVLMRAASRFERKVLRFGLGAQNDVRGVNIRNSGREGVTFSILYGGSEILARLRVPGLYNVSNALAAAAVGLQLGATSEDVAEGLATYQGMKGRFMITKLACGAILVDDTYNSNPFSLRAALDSLQALAEGKRLIVGLGEMLELGSETLQAHGEAGALVAKFGAHAFVALGEHAGLMIQGAVENGLPNKRAFVAGDHREMERRIREIMGEGDFVFLKGSRRAGLEKVAEKLKETAPNAL